LTVFLFSFLITRFSEVSVLGVPLWSSFFAGLGSSAQILTGVADDLRRYGLASRYKRLWYMAMPLLAILQTIGPFDYNTADITLRGAPLIFLAIAIFGTLYLQSMHLDDEYGKEKPEAPEAGASPKARLVFYATRITGGKLGVSLLLIAFGALYELNLVGHYFRETRAYTDKLPERAWQFDAASKYTIGTGFLPALTSYL
jgi:hypothetical protein